MINLFIDTNVLLSFYHLTSEDLEELKKLAALIDNKEIRLFITEQVKNEFTRNREGKIFDAMKKLREAKFSLSFPLFAKDYKEYGELRDLMKKADELHSELIKRITLAAEIEELSADKVVAALFQKAENIAVSDELYLRAVKRVQLGNPPGKEGSMGDAVNWECILSKAPQGEDIYIVSGDKDFRSQLSEGEISEYLDKEWCDAKKSSLCFYPKISDFFKQNFPHIKIASEVERDLLIQRLSESYSFARTHEIIAKLLTQSEFSPTQVERLIDIAQTNNQVGWIVDDDDVHEFYVLLSQKYGKEIQQDAAQKLTTIVEKGNKGLPFLTE